MSSTDNNATMATTGDDKVGGMPEADVNFLICCLQNANGGVISIDCTKVADELGFKNHRSVQNKIALLKKKYDLPLSSSALKGDTPLKASAPKSRKASSAGGMNEPAITATPSKQRVTKARTPSTKKKAAPKKVGKKAKSEESLKAELDEEADADHEDVDMEDSETGTTIHVGQDAAANKADSDENTDHEEV